MTSPSDLYIFKMDNIINSPLTNKYVTIPGIFTWEFNVLEIEDIFILKNVIYKVFKTLFEEINFRKIDETKIKNFINDVSERYNNVPYHNLYHATNVLHITYMLLKTCNLLEKLNNFVSFSILLSSLAHDIDHPGNNNIFEVNTNSDLAFKYNDLSVLEQHHCVVTFNLIKKNKIFENFTNNEYNICRKTIIKCILGTDMENHKNIYDEIQSKNLKNFNIDYELIENQYLIGKIILHCADISNPINSSDIYEKWSRMISVEFNNQILKEIEAGLTPFSSFNINNDLSFYLNEIKYIKYVCKPYWELMSEIFPILKDRLENINININVYSEKYDKLKKENDINMVFF
jgi:hypothetical protein